MTGLEGSSGRDVCRLLAAIFPTRVERALERVVEIAYRCRPTYSVGHAADYVRVRLQRRRADRAFATGRSLAPARRGA